MVAKALIDLLATSLTERVPHGVTCGIEHITDAAGLLPEELDLVKPRWVPERIASFAAGRRAARRALGVDAPILMRLDGAPVWPDGFDGSISHDGRFAVAVAAHGRCPVTIDLIDFTAAAPEQYLETAAKVAHRDDILPTDGASAARAFAMKEVAIKAAVGSNEHARFQDLLVKGTKVIHPESGDEITTVSWQVEEILITLGQRLETPVPVPRPVP